MHKQDSKYSKSLAIALIASFLLVGCTKAGLDRQSKIGASTANGAVAGLILGNALWGGEKWALLFTGATATASSVGASKAMEHYTAWDAPTAEVSIYNSLENSRTGETVHWQSEDGLAEGAFTPIRSYIDEAGRQCREMQIITQADGTNSEQTRTACKMPAGEWEVY